MHPPSVSPSHKVKKKKCINTKCISLIGRINSPNIQAGGLVFQTLGSLAHSCFPPNSKSRLLRLAYRFKILETELLVVSFFFSFLFLFPSCMSFKRIDLENGTIISICNGEGEKLLPTPPPLWLSGLVRETSV